MSIHIQDASAYAVPSNAAIIFNENGKGIVVCQWSSRDEFSLVTEDDGLVYQYRMFFMLYRREQDRSLGRRTFEEREPKSTTDKHSKRWWEIWR